MIKLDDLKKNAWYYGEGSNTQGIWASVALWDSRNFLTIDIKTHTLKTLTYNTQFKPLTIIDSSFTPDILETISNIFTSLSTKE
jgi:hypothetical protein